MYIDPADHEKVLQEIHRVLKPEGRLMIWDAVFPARKTSERQTYVLFPLHVKLPAKAINASYGVRFVEGQSSDHFIDLAKKNGFDVASRKDERGWLFGELSKRP